MMLKLLCGLCVALLAHSGHASSDENHQTKSDPFLNLALSYFTEEGYPASWYIEASPGTVEITQELSSKWHGAALTISGKEPVVMYTPILVGQCIKKLGATVQTKSTDKVSASIFFINPLKGGINSAEPLPGVGNFQKVSHQIESPNKCFEETILMGVMLTGHGKVNIAKFELSINDKRFHDGKQPDAVTQEKLQEIKQHAVAVATQEPIQTQPNLDAIKPWLEQTKVVGLGENSHGAKHLFLLKSKLIQYLVETEDFTQVALEMPAITAQTIDDYIQGKHDDRKAVLFALNYPSWQVESMMELIDWLKVTNVTRDIPIVFSGFDVQQPRLTLDQLQNRVANLNDQEAINLLKELKSTLDSRKTKEELGDSLDRLALYFDKNIPSLKRYITVLKQGLILQRPDLGQGTRAKFMASQALLLSRDHKTILWGDNTHITKKGSAMGGYIAKELGDKYKAVGFSFHEGTYSAYGPDNPYKAHPSFEGTHEFILNQVEQEAFLVNLDKLPKLSPLLDLRGFRYIGSRPQEYTQFYPHRLKEHFNFIGFVKSTDSTKYLLDHQF